MQTILSPNVLPNLMRTIDFMVAVLLAILSSLIMEGAFAGIKYDILAGIFSAVLLCNYMNFIYGYGFRNLFNPWKSMWKVGLCWIVVFFSISGIALITGIREDFYLRWYALYNVTAILVLMILHGIIAVAARYYERAGAFKKRVVIIGTGRVAKHCIASLKKANVVEIVAVFDESYECSREVFCGFELQGSVEDVIVYARAHDIDQIILAVSWEEEEQILSIVNTIKVLPVDIQLCPNPLDLVLGKSGVTNIGGVFLVNAFSNPLSGWDFLLKELEDRVLSVLILILASPVMLLIALLIKLTDGGDIFFKQKRHGFNNQEFYVYKFRSMKAHKANEGEIEQATKEDERITKIGAFIRRTSLDELPQFFNVLKREMSIVGPRPHAVEHTTMYSPLIQDYMARHRVKPGITGLAQIRGFRGETDTLDKMADRVDCDIEYIENWSLYLDAVIIVKTLFLGFVHKNAY